MTKKVDKKEVGKRLDNFVNSLSGTGEGKRESTYFQVAAGFVDETTLTEFYKQNWLARKIVDLPVTDALSADLEFNSDSNLDNFLAKIEELDVMSKVRQAMKTARIYGGAAIILGFKEGNITDLENPVIEENVKELKTLNVVDAYELHPYSWDSDVTSPTFGLPSIWMYNPNAGGGQAASEVGIKIHASRVLLFIGDYIPKRGYRNQSSVVYPYGQSELITNAGPVRDYSIVDDAAVEISQSFGIKTLSVENLFDLLRDSEGCEMLEVRAEKVNTHLSAHRTLLIDTNEKLEFRNPSIGGFDNILNHVIDQVCGSSLIPRQRLFTQQMGTLAGAEETTKSYYDFLVRLQESISHNLDTIFDYVALETGVTEYDWNFADFSNPDNKTVAETRRIQAETDKIYIEMGVLTPEEVETSRFEGGYSMETMLQEGETGDVNEEPKEEVE